MCVPRGCESASPRGLNVRTPGGLNVRTQRSKGACPRGLKVRSLDASKCVLRGLKVRFPEVLNCSSFKVQWPQVLEVRRRTKARGLKLEERRLEERIILRWRTGAGAGGKKTGREKVFALKD